LGKGQEFGRHLDLGSLAVEEVTGSMRCSACGGSIVHQEQCCEKVSEGSGQRLVSFYLVQIVARFGLVRAALKQKGGIEGPALS